MANEQVQGVPAGLTEVPIQGIPPGLTEIPVQKTQTIEGVPPGLMEVPLNTQTPQMVTNSVGETMPADVAARHALTREGNVDTRPEITGPWASTAKLGNVVEDVATGVSKKGLETVQGFLAAQFAALVRPNGVRDSAEFRS